MKYVTKATTVRHRVENTANKNFFRKMIGGCNFDWTLVKGAMIWAAVTGNLREHHELRRILEANEEYPNTCVIVGDERDEVFWMTTDKSAPYIVGSDAVKRILKDYKIINKNDLARLHGARDMAGASGQNVAESDLTMLIDAINRYETLIREDS